MTPPDIVCSPGTLHVALDSQPMPIVMLGLFDTPDLVEQSTEIHLRL
jgi:hypothetical protein